MSFARHFMLINADGEEYDITNTKVLLTSPSGLGMKRENSYRRIGNRFYLLSVKRGQENFKGELTFTPPDAYIKYNEFMAFCTKEPLKLRYKPIDNQEYYEIRGSYPKWDYVFYQDVMLASIEKADLTKWETLECNIELTPLTPWYRDLTLMSTIVDKDDGVVWEQSSTFTWKWENGSVNNIQFEADCQMDSPCKLMIPGPATSILWRHYVNSKEIEQGSLDFVIPFGHYLVIDNTGETYTITLQKENGEIINDIYQNVDFLKDKFLNIKNGINSIVANLGDSGNYPMILEVKLYYESV